MRVAALALVAERIPLLPARSETVSFQGQPQAMNSHGRIQAASASPGYNALATPAVKNARPILGY